MTPRPYQRGLLVTILAYHQRVEGKGCNCGWNTLGASFAEHVADIYEASLGGPNPAVRYVSSAGGSSSG